MNTFKKMLVMLVMVGLVGMGVMGKVFAASTSSIVLRLYVAANYSG